MSDAVSTIYNQDEYPAMSHPTGHPAVMAASALLGGLRTAPLERARILEIGCSSGHHILPIAAAFPEASITAIDLSASAIAKACELATAAGIQNVNFLCTDIRQWLPEPAQYDYIIAHGFFSWVADDVKSALLRLCERALAPQGVAMISYNTQPGWSLRQPLREMTHALRQFPSCHNSAVKALDLMENAMADADTDYGKYLLSLVRETKEKGEQQLKFDDLAPINDPCYFSQFVQWCDTAGLQYVSESDIALSNPAMLPNGAKSLLPQLGGDPLMQQQLADFFTGRAFRTSLLCKKEAKIQPPSEQEISALSIEILLTIPETGNAVTDQIGHAINESHPHCRPVQTLLADIKSCSPAQAVTIILQLAQLGLLRLRSIPYECDRDIPEKPQLSRLNQIHFNAGKPIIDAMHLPCQLASTDRELLAHCNGQNSFHAIMRKCQNDKQVEEAHAMIQHLVDRGLLI